MAAPAYLSDTGFLIVNKMDQNGTDKDKLMKELKKQLNDGCIEFGQVEMEDFYDQLAMCEEIMMETFLETGQIVTWLIKRAVTERKVFPCFFAIMGQRS